MSGRSPPLYCTLIILITMRSHHSYPNITTVIHSYEYSTNVDNSTIETYNAPRDFLHFFFFFFFFSERAARGGGGVRCQTFSFSFFPCSADHERDWPPCKVFFFGLATNALNV